MPLLRIIDLWGMGFGHLRFAKDFLAVAVQQTVALYPETLDRVLVVNAETCQTHPCRDRWPEAWSFAALLWPMLKQLLHPVTQRKVEIVDAHNTSARVEGIDWQYWHTF